MGLRQRRKEWLIVLFFGGVLCLNYPLLSLFSRDSRLYGIPTLYLYLFLFWAIFIGLMALAVGDEKGPRGPSQPPTSSSAG